MKAMKVLALVCLSILYVCCNSGREETAADRRDTKRLDPRARAVVVEHPQVNPVAVRSEGFSEPAKGRESLSCLQINILQMRVSRRPDSDYALAVHNACDRNMALLVGPVEVYRRQSEADFFVTATIVEPVYATLYVFRAELGMGAKSFLGDGGLEVQGWPKYAIIPTYSDVELPLVDRAGLIGKLPPGKYGAMLTTLAAPTVLRERGESFIDLGGDVSRFNRENQSGLVGVHPDARIVSSPVYYFFSPTPGH